MSDAIVFGPTEPAPPRDRRWREFRKIVVELYPHMLDVYVDMICDIAGTYWQRHEREFGK